MSKILVITEKDKQAKSLMQGLHKSFTTKSYKGKNNKSKRSNLFYESDEVIIVPATGHLFTLYDVSDYLGIQEKKVNWRDFSDKIPYVPQYFKLKIANDFAHDQFELIKLLINRDDVEKIYNCADPDAEGELLLREILTEARNTKPVMRMETKSIVPSVMADAFYSPYNSNNYNKLYFEALARQQTDWLTGINYTTMLTLKTGVFFPIGRVLYAIVLYVYNARKKINDFKPTTTYGVKATINRDDKEIIINSFEPDISFSKDKKKECSQLCNQLKNKTTVVTNVEKSKKNLSPKRLYTTSKLYADLSSAYGISMESAAKAAQELYEDGRIMYPRTECEYLQTSEIENTRKIIDMYKNAGYPVDFHSNKSVFNDEKCGKKGEGGHTAIIVTNKPYSDAEFQQLSPTVKATYLTILKRTLANFANKPDIDETKVTFRCGEYTFKVVGNVINSKGFLEFEHRSLPDELPSFYEGEVIKDIKYEVAERKTKAPPAPTQSRLLAYLKDPFSNNDGTNDYNEKYYDIIKKGATIGTGATMAVIATKAVNYDYLSLKKGIYDITQKGTNLVELLHRLNFHQLDPERTLEMNKNIIAIGERMFTLEQNKENIRKELEQASWTLKNSNIVISSTPDIGDKKNVLGKCPKCGSSVIEADKTFHCSNKTCSFVLFKNDLFFKKAFDKKLTKTMVKGLLSSKRTAKITGIKSKNKVDENGKPKKYGVNVKVDFSGDYPKYEIIGFISDNRSKKNKEYSNG